MTGAILLALAASTSTPAVTYDVRCGPRCAELHVEAALPAARGARLEIDTGLGAFLRGAQFEEDGRWADAVVRGDEVLVAGCQKRPCRVRYRVRLLEAARQLRDRGRAFAQEEMVIAPPSSWLLRPARAGKDDRFRLTVSTPAGTGFATGLFPGAAPGAYEGLVEDLAEAPYSAFGSFGRVQVQAGKRTVDVAIAPGLAHLRRDIVAWVEAGVRDVGGYFGGFPVPHALVLVLEGRRTGISFGSTLGNGGASIMIWVAPSTAPETLATDWVLVHEMVHFALPTVPRQHRWLEEGLATYVEPFARAAGGRITSTDVWSGLLDGLPRGAGEMSGRGLDDSTSWASTYWGGAVFSFLADVGIRERTGNRRSLRDALRGIGTAGGSIAVRWPLQRTLEAADAATGTTVLRELHDRMGTRRVDVDLDGVWRKLGISRRGRRVALDERAPLARIRRSMTEGATGRR